MSKKAKKSNSAVDCSTNSTVDCSTNSTVDCGNVSDTTKATDCACGNKSGKKGGCNC